MNYFYQFVCPNCRKAFEYYLNDFCCDACGNVLFADYDLYKARQELVGTGWSTPQSLWEFNELLPLTDLDDVVTIQEGGTPVWPLRNFANLSGISSISVKNEACNPGGSLRDREMSVLFSYLAATNFSGVVLESQGVLGVSAGSYGARSNKRCLVFSPEDVPTLLVNEYEQLGVNVKLIDWNQSSRQRLQESVRSQKSVFDISQWGYTLRIEGAKTILYELVCSEPKMPDVLLVPTGAGITLTGVWKGMNELQKLGILKRGQMPKVWAVQSSSCQSLLHALEGEPFDEDKVSWTIASELNVAHSRLYPFLGRVMRDNNWQVVSVSDPEILKARQIISKTEGILLSPEGAAAVAAVKKLIMDGKEAAKQSFMILNPSNGSRCVNEIQLLKN